MQTFLALAIVASAAGYLIWRTWKFVAGRRSAGCGTACGSCPASESNGLPAQKPLVTIAPLRTSGNKEAV